MITHMNREQPTISGGDESSSKHEQWSRETDEYEYAREHTIQTYLYELEMGMSTRLKKIKEEIEKKKYELRKPEVLPYMREKRLAEICEYETFVSDLERELEELHAPKNTKEVSTDIGDFRIVYEKHSQKNSEGVLKDLDAYAKELVLRPGNVSHHMKMA
ncbi:MAG: hypothetical protein H8D63_03290 [Parcubacteria group bacterium]|nr:hypothetical protein [Parcubacteria group bacterium]